MFTDSKKRRKKTTRVYEIRSIYVYDLSSIQYIIIRYLHLYKHSINRCVGVSYIIILRLSV